MDEKERERRKDKDRKDKRIINENNKKGRYISGLFFISSLQLFKNRVSKNRATIN